VLVSALDGVDADIYEIYRREGDFGPAYRELRSRFAAGQRAELRCGSCVMNYAGVERCVSHAFPVLSEPVVGDRG